MKTVTITFPLREQIQVITVAEHGLLLSHPSHADAADFLSAQYGLCMDKSMSIVEAVRAGYAQSVQEPVEPSNTAHSTCAVWSAFALF